MATSKLTQPPVNRPVNPTVQTIKDNHLSLNDCHQLLIEELGNAAPSLITLKRWSASGILDGAKAVGQGAIRAKYKVGTVFQIVKDTFHPSLHARQIGHSAHLDRTSITLSDAQQEGDNNADDRLNHAGANGPPTGPQMGASIANASVIDADQIKRILEPLVEEALRKTQSELNRAILQVDDIRKTLMIRYDNELHALKNKVVELTAENARLKNASASSSDNTKILIQLSRISDTVNEIAKDR